jgi:sarcosine oxidase
MPNYDIIVLGVGSMGSAACYYLASRGLKILGLEQFDIPHDRGSHAGQSRIIRKAYFEHPDYVPLLQRAYENWTELEHKTGHQVYWPTGLLYAGQPAAALIIGVIESSEKYNIPIEKLSSVATRSRFPAFHIPDDYEVVFEPDAGFLTPERAIALFVEQAIQSGAEIHTKENATSWKREGDSMVVTTNRNTYACQKLIITAGPWAAQMIPSLSADLKVTRQAIGWMIPHHSQLFRLDYFPCWLIDDHTQPGMHYGFPMLPVGRFGPPVGLKVAHHYPGKITHPDQVDRQVHPDDEEQLIATLKKFIPKSYAHTHTMRTCLYTNTPDEHFIIDFLPEHEKKVVIAAGFSGHGFKFASVVGEVLADLAVDGNTRMPVGFLSLDRFCKS